MKYTTLPQTNIKVSKICLGTMTWGEQNTEAEGHEQMDYALEQGINFFWERPRSDESNTRFVQAPVLSGFPMQTPFSRRPNKRPVLRRIHPP